MFSLVLLSILRTGGIYFEQLDENDLLLHIVTKQSHESQQPHKSDHKSLSGLQSTVLVRCWFAGLYSYVFLQSQHLIRPFNPMANNQVWLQCVSWFLCNHSASHTRQHFYLLISPLYNINSLAADLLISWCDLHSRDTQLSFSHHSLGHSGLFCHTSPSSVGGHAEARPLSLKRSIGPFSDKRTTGMCVCAWLYM